MDKYSLLIFHADLGPFLERLQELGMVDTRRENRAVDNHSKELFELNAKYKLTSKRLSLVLDSIEDKSKIDYSFVNKKDDPQNLLLLAEESLNNKSILEQELQQTTRESHEAKLWGEFNKEDIDKLRSLGYELHFYALSEKKFDPKWQSEHILQILNKVNGKNYFVVLNPVGEEFKFDIPESKFPQSSYHILEAKIKQLQKEIEENNKKIEAYTLLIDVFNKCSSTIGEKLDLYLANASSPREAEGTIAMLTGFAPVDKRKSVCDFLDNQGVYYQTTEANEADNPPIKLKNNFFSRLYEPIGELYMLPKYGELDLTPFFAPFYMLFFGFCLGDMGYGLILLIGAGLAKYKLKKMKPYLTLVQFLGLGAIIMASLSGVFFGAKLADILPLSDSVKGMFFTDIKMFWFAIIFGLVQIVAARLIYAIDAIIRKGWQFGMSNIGWSIVIVWGSLAYAGTMVPELILPAFVHYIGLFGALLILFFSSTQGNIFLRIIKGAFSFYDVTGVFGDMLSYIRLFGLGTAGGILGMVVNAVAMQMAGIPYVGWLFTGLMLLVGHSAVLMLSSLGAFVHPMRLTFVEFYKNAGFTGGGKAFRPLTKENSN